MTRQAAKAFYDVQAGDPATGYITPADAQAALDVVYDDMAASSVPRITGSPEGVRAGNPGDEVIQTDATTDVKGFIRWIKTGTGTTGWIPGPEADTGWRDVSATLTNGWTGSLRIRRTGPRATIAAEYIDAGPTLDGSAATAVTFITLPAGFRPGKLTVGLGGPYRLLGAAVTDGGSVMKPLMAQAGNGLQLPVSSKYAFEVSYLTADPWPASLPGTVATFATP